MSVDCIYDKTYSVLALSAAWASAAVILPCSPASNNSFEVVRQGKGTAADVLSLLFGDGNPFALALKDILALKLCDRCEHSEHKLASGRGCVDGLLAADKLDLFLGQAFYKIEQVAGYCGRNG